MKCTALNYSTQCLQIKIAAGSIQRQRSNMRKYWCVAKQTSDSEFWQTKRVC